MLRYALIILTAATVPTTIQAADSWQYVKTISGPGNVNGLIGGLDPSWVRLKFRWSSPCPSPRSITIVDAYGNNAGVGASKQFDDLGAVGEVDFLLPAASATVTAVMTNGPCEAKSEIQVFATHDAGPTGTPTRVVPAAATVPVTPAQAKQGKAGAKARAKEYKQRVKAAQAATEAQNREIMMMHCIQLSNIPMGQLTSAQQSSIRSCRYLGLL